MCVPLCVCVCVCASACVWLCVYGQRVPVTSSARDVIPGGGEGESDNRSMRGETANEVAGFRVTCFVFLNMSPFVVSA